MAIETTLKETNAGRPPKGDLAFSEQVQGRVNAQTFAQFDEIRSKKGVTESEAVREAIGAYVQKFAHLLTAEQAKAA